MRAMPRRAAPRATRRDERPSLRLPRTFLIALSLFPPAVRIKLYSRSPRARERRRRDGTRKARARAQRSLMARADGTAATEKRRGARQRAARRRRRDGRSSDVDSSVAADVAVAVGWLAGSDRRTQQATGTRGQQDGRATRTRGRGGYGRAARRGAARRGATRYVPCFPGAD